MANNRWLAFDLSMHPELLHCAPEGTKLKHPGDLHLTLAYFKSIGNSHESEIIEFMDSLHPVEIELQGLTTLSDHLVISVHSHELFEFNMRAQKNWPEYFKNEREYYPHITLGKIDELRTAYVTKHKLLLEQVIFVETKANGEHSIVHRHVC